MCIFALLLSQLGMMNTLYPASPLHHDCPLLLYLVTMLSYPLLVRLLVNCSAPFYRPLLLGLSRDMGISFFRQPVSHEMDL